MQRKYINKILLQLSVIILWFVVFILISEKSICQQAKNDTKPLDSTLSLYKSGKISENSYLKQVDSIITVYPFILTNNNLKILLSNYKDIAWSNKKYHSFRINYYDYLSENAYMNNMAGASIYYAEKKEEELKKVTPYINSLGLLRKQYSIYNQIAGGNKFSGVKSYYENLPFFEWLPKGIEKDSVPVSTIKNAFLIMQSQASIFAFQGDSITTTKIRALSDRILKTTLAKFSKNAELIERLTAYHYLICHYEKRVEHKLDEAVLNLIKARQITSTLILTGGKRPPWKIGFEDNILIHLVDIYLDYKKIDSAAKYLDTLKAFENKLFGNKEGSYILKSTARLNALKGDYKVAYEADKRSSEITDSVFALRTVDINNNLYAQTQAEDARDELGKSQSQKRKLYISIAGIILLLLLSVLIFTYRIRKKEREAKMYIHDLNTASQIQITELEEKNRMIKLEEQKKLGMDLHDNMASTIAAVKINIESEIKNTQDENQKERLQTIKNHIINIYESTRNKSHELYHGKEDEFEISFSKRIKLMIDNAFSSNKYKTEITVDDNALLDASIEIKIELLYIIQEAITNIIKHSKANTVSVLIYEDISGLVLNISDNGKGFNTTQQRKGIGLSSIKDRAANVNGVVLIESSNKGTEVNITIPLTA